MRRVLFVVFLNTRVWGGFLIVVVLVCRVSVCLQAALLSPHVKLRVFELWLDDIQPESMCVPQHTLIHRTHKTTTKRTTNDQHRGEPNRYGLAEDLCPEERALRVTVNDDTEIVSPCVSVYLLFCCAAP